MRKPRFHASLVERYLKEKQYATLDQLKSAMGTSVTMTVFRKLKGLGYISSCSHRGKYYSLERIARFDDAGLWRPDGILFSTYGTLIDTVEHFVCESDSGYTAGELRALLSIDVRESLMQLWVETRLARTDLDGVYLYTSPQRAVKLQQLTSRRQRMARTIGSSSLEQEVKAAIILFYSMLDEKQRRLYAGLESIKLGHGGDAAIARLLDLDVKTISKGRSELLEADIERERIRRPGAGRVEVKKKPGSDRGD